MNSRQVNLFEVYEFLAAYLGDPGLIVGTPAWCRLDDRDPAKWSAVLWAAVWWAVVEDARQAAVADASRQISASADWSRIGRPRPASYIPRTVAS